MDIPKIVNQQKKFFHSNSTKQVSLRIETLKKFVPSSTLDKNLEAFELGKMEAQEFLKKLKEES